MARHLAKAGHDVTVCTRTMAKAAAWVAAHGGQAAATPAAAAVDAEVVIACVGADADLRARLAAEHPAVWARIQARRAFMQETLGIALKPEVLPFSAAPAYMPPAWLSPETVCVLRP